MTPTKIELREMRKKRGLTQVELAEACGVPQSTVSRIEAGTTAINLELLDALCDALECKPGNLIVKE